nr:non-ribosomal peptide synthetase [Streptomyces sulphureus]
MRGSKAFSQGAAPMTDVDAARLPLTTAQRSLWFAQQLDPQSTAHTIAEYVDVRGEFDPSLLHQAVARVTDEVDALRATLTGSDDGRQLVHPRLDIAVPLTDLSGHPAAEATALDLMWEDLATPSDPTGVPVTATALFRLAPSRHLLHLRTHHAVLDGYGAALVLGRIAETYTLLAQGASVPERPLPLAPLVEEDLRYNASPERSQDAEYWRRRLDGAPAPVRLAEAAANPAHKAVGHNSRIAPMDWDRLREAARSVRVAWPALFVAATALYTHRVRAVEDVVLGMPVTGRQGRTARATPGMMSQVLPLRLQVSASDTAGGLLRRVTEGMRGVLRHQRYPVEELRRERGLLPGQPLTGPAVNVLAFDEDLRFGPASGTLHNLALGPVEDLTLAVHPGAGGGARVDVLADEALHRPAALAGHLERILDLTESLAADPARRVASLRAVAPGESAGVLALAAGPPLGREPSTVPEELARQAGETPDKTAVSDGAHALTFAELDGAAEALASVLHAEGAVRGTTVAVALPRSVDTVVALLAVLRAGAVYMPVDPASPADRIAHLLHDARPVLLLCEPDGPAARRAPEGTLVRTVLHRAVHRVGAPSGVPHEQTRVGLHDAVHRAGAPTDASGDQPRDVGAPADAPHEQARAGLHDAAHRVGMPTDIPDDHSRTSLPATAHRTAPAPQGPKPDDGAYLVHTSGSTGRPKGVLVPHRALGNLLEHHRAESHAEAARAEGRRLRVALTASTAFDAAWDPLLWMLAGHELHLVDEAARRDPEETVAFLEAHRIDVIETTPSFLRQLLAAGLMRPGAHRPRVVALGGEPVNDELWQRLSGEPGLLAYNFYGPTEATVDAVTTRIAGSAPAIGRPVRGARAQVLDAALQPLPAGAVGELYLAGECLARGYAGRPGPTADRFLADPFGPPGARMYRTGDLARWGEGGVLEFVGRSDDQVKVRGHRVETGEVESALAALPGVAQAAVVPRGGTEHGELAAYLVPTADEQGTALRGEQLAVREALSAALPSYMVPTAYAAVDRLPLTPNGKLDTAALPPPRVPAPRERALPRTAAEETVGRVLAGLLGLEEAGRDDDFFALGGHSLLATRLLTRLAEETGVRLPVRALFASPTVAGIAALLEAEDTEPVPSAPERPERLPLSAAQQRLWLLERMGEGGERYHVPAVVRLEGEVDLAALQRAFADLVARHEALRTVYREDAEGSHQVVLPADECGVALDVAAAVAGPEALPVPEFDLAARPPVQALVAPLAAVADTYVLALTFHHIAADGWSMGVLVRDLGDAYAARRAGRAPQLPPLPAQYADHALAERARLGSREDPDSLTARQLDFWEHALVGAPPELPLPFDRPRPPRAAPRGGRVPLRLDAAVHRSVVALAREAGTSPFMVLHAALVAVLHRLGAGDDLVVGTPVAGREAEEFHDVVGFFVNTLVLRVDAGGDPGFRELLCRTREADLAAYAHQDVPFEQVVERVAPPRSLARHPLFQVMLALNNTPRQDVELPGLRAEPVAAERPTAKFDLTWDLAEEHDADGRPAGLTGSVEYSSALFDEATARRFAAHFARLLGSALAEPELPLSRLGMLTAQEREAALDNGGEEGPAEPAPMQSICDVLATQAAVTPARTAVVDAERAVPFGDLAVEVDAVAHRLAAAGVGRGDRVAVALPPSARQVSAVFGTLRAGAVHVPLDPSHPPERNMQILRSSRPAALLTERSCSRALPEWHAPTLHLDAPPAERTASAPLPPEEGPCGTDAAYVLYTSGSTGAPKGVVVEHRSLANLLRHHGSRLIEPAERAHGGRPLRVALTAAPTFDASWDPLLWMVAGHELHTVDEATRRDPEALVAFLRARRIDVVETTPSLLEQLRACGLFAPGSPRPTVVALGGEPVGEALWGELAALHGVSVWNLYGPTEATVDSTAAPVTAGSTPHLGRAVTGVRARVLDPYLGPAAPGATGELYLSGAGLARGYDGAHGRTAERFLADPYGPPGGRMYRTGDLVRRLPGGELQFVGRADGQVNVRGFRVETGEVEAALAAHTGVRRAAAAVREAPGGGRLAAWVVPETGAAPSAVSLRSFAASRLPGYMVPSHLALVDELPLTAHGKTDFAALPEPAPAGPATGEAPRTPQEELVCALFAECLGAEHVGRDADFFALGGHSLLATRIVDRVRAAFGAELPVRALFEDPTPAGLARRLTGAARGRPVLRALHERPAHVPLSFAQQRLWFLNRLHPQDASYNLPMAVRLRGRVDVPALRAALCDVVARHESLRTVFPDAQDAPGTPVQRVLAPGDARPPLPVTRCSPGEAAGLLRAAARRGFALTHQPPLRAELFTEGEESHTLLVVVHHIAADGWSMGPLAQDLAAAYAARRAGRAPDWSPLPVQYADYTLWQRELLGDPSDPESLHAGQLAYWRRTLADAPAELPLPCDRPRPEAASGEGGSVPIPLDASDGRRLAALAKEEGASTFMALHALLAALLDRYGTGTDTVVGSPVAGRSEEALGGLVGFFVNTLVLRLGTEGDPDLRALLARARQADLAAYAHQELPFEALVESLAPPRSLARHPLFQVMLSLNNAGRPELDLPGLHASVEGVDTAGAKFDLSFAFTEEAAGALTGVLEFSRDLFDAATAQRLADSFAALLHSALAEPDAPLSTHEPLGPDERAHLLARGEGGASAPAHPTVVAGFSATASAHPEEVAVRAGASALTYGELARESAALARLLRERGVRRGETVAVVLPRSTDSLTSLLGVLTAGAVYAPVDDGLPPARVAAVLSDARPAAVVTAGAARVPDGPWHLVDLAAPRAAAELAASEPPFTESGPEPCDAAYVVHTSGSTGRPKGVVVEHGSLTHLWEHHRRALFAPACAAAGGRRLRVALTASLSFDASWDPVLWMLEGHELLVVDSDTRRDPAALAAMVREQRIDVLETTPTHASALLDAGLCSPGGHRPLVLALGGEAVPPALWQRLRDEPGLTAWNLYGPTEATVDTLCLPLHRAERPVLGEPVDGTRAYVLDRFLRPSPPGATGELYLSGASLARGYLNRPGETAARFVADPFAGGGARMYRTGDLARWTADGLEFRGRADEQVKVRGFRVEPGEVSAVLERLPGVARAAVAVRGASCDAGGRLVAYVVPEDGPSAAPERGALHAAAAGELPGYMVPSAFVLLDRLPLTPNGKLDHAALPEPADEHLLRQAGTPPSGPREDLLCTLFAEVLGAERVWADDDFFALGGHSLLAARLLARVEGATGVGLGIRALFEAPTPAALAEALAAEESGTGTRGADLATLLPLRTRGARPPLFCVHPAGGLAWPYAGFLQHLEDRPVYGLQTPNLQGDRPFPASIGEMAAGYVEELRTVRPHGPYHLLGWSFGGNVAQEMAVQLREAGEEVALLALLDAYPKAPIDGLEDAGRGAVFRALLANLGFAASSWESDEDLDAGAVRDALREAGSPLGALEPGTIETMVANFAAQARLMRHHSPRVFPGDVLFFRAADEDPSGGLTPAMWHPHTEGVLRVHDVPCTHALMTHPDSRAVIGPVLAEELGRR